MTWSCTDCTDGETTQTLTDVYGSWVLTESTGVWVYTLNNADAETDALDGGESVDETVVVVVSDGALTDSVTVTVTITGDDDAPTTSTPSTQAGTEDTVFTGYAVADFPFTDVDGDDSALVSIMITVVESTGDLEKSTDGSSWTDVAANDVILNANIQHLRLNPAADSTTSVTFTYTVARRHPVQRHRRHDHQFLQHQRPAGQRRRHRLVRRGQHVQRMGCRHRLGLF